MTAFSDALTKCMRRLCGGDGDIAALLRLSGGANMESWSFDYAGRGYVMRRAPGAEMMAGRPYGHDVEAALIQMVHDAGIMAPQIVGSLCTDDDLGTGFIMYRVEAEVHPAKICGDPPPNLITDLGRELAKIHGVPVPDLPAIPHISPADMLAELRAQFWEYGGDRPVIAMALAWCAANQPAPVKPVLVHGDFRMGNIMADEQGLRAILDWELAHIGDRHEDLAWGCVGAWRFGHYDRPAFGISGLETYFAAYEDGGGERVDRDSFKYWLVHRTIWWALGCLKMGQVWRDGIDRNLERAVIGRRAVECELDILLLLGDDMADGEEIAPDFDAQVLAENMGEPCASELVRAVGEWILTDIKPGMKGRDKFMAAVALNALGIVGRELDGPVAISDRPLCAHILAGDVTLLTPGILGRLRMQTMQKAMIDTPKYAGLSAAKAKWS